MISPIACAALPLSSGVNASLTMTKSTLNFSLVTGFLTCTLHFPRALTDDLFSQLEVYNFRSHLKVFKVTFG